jgi:DNA-binding MarR family transcriptional regulator
VPTDETRTITPRPFPAPASSTANDIARQFAAALRTVDLENRRLRAEFGRTAGVTDSEFHAITVISESEAATPKMLANELGLTTGAVTAMLDRLETAGLVRRQPHPSDRRSLVLSLTANGAAVREWMYGTYLDAIRDATMWLGTDAIVAASEVLLSTAATIRDTTVNLDRVIPGVCMVTA